MSVGIVGGWMLAILGLSYYFRGRIGPQRWRKLHRFTALAWVLGLVHAIGQGTDAGTAWFLIAIGMVALPAGALLVRRLTPTPTVTVMRFDCFGTHCGVWAESGAGDARRRLLAWHDQFSRFRADSELSRLNADPRTTVPVSATMARLLGAIAEAAQATGGLVDGTLANEIDAAGYTTDIGSRSRSASPWRSPRRERRPAPRRLARVLPRAGGRRCGSCAGRRAWRSTAAGSPRACSPT